VAAADGRRELPLTLSAADAELLLPPLPAAELAVGAEVVVGVEVEEVEEEDEPDVARRKGSNSKADATGSLPAPALPAL
jgi:hypothetical protein